MVDNLTGRLARFLRSKETHRRHEPFTLDAPYITEPLLPENVGGIGQRYRARVSSLNGSRPGEGLWAIRLLRIVSGGL